MCNAGFCESPGCACWARKHPLIAAWQGGQQVRNKGREGHSAVAFNLVLQFHAAPLKIHVFPLQFGQFFPAGTRQQQALQVGGNGGVLYLANMGEPCGQLLALQIVVLGLGLTRYLAHLLGARRGRVGFALQVGFSCGPSHECFQQAQRQANTGGAVLGFFGGPRLNGWCSQFHQSQRHQFGQWPRHRLDAR